MTDGTLTDHGGTAVLVLERRYPHPPELVWRAVTEPAELAHWFPARVELRLEPGAPIRFRMADEGEDDPHTTGEVLEVDPPRRFAFRWDTDVLRMIGAIAWAAQASPDPNAQADRLLALLLDGPRTR